MRKFIIVILALMSMSAMADQVIFSQYDGDHTWTNMIINVSDARTFKEPGVAYIKATDGYKNIERFGAIGVRKVISNRTITIVTGDYNEQTTWNFSQVGDAQSTSYEITSHSQIASTVVSTPDNTTAGNNSGFADSTTNTNTHAQPDLQDWSDAAISALAQGAAVYNDVAAVEGELEGESKPRIAKTEQPQVAKAVVVVPKDANMYFFVLYFFDERITYLQLLDNYQNMHPLVPFTGNK